ncbi:cation transporter [Pelotalea chapellei]|uniref:Cation transporter n=1 Tax=Pelotalea chapellei TaxID=44671 RepID=A0ABS5U6J8_9BACT|nr:cation transporter [Pelotalea chapellei]MBT1071289.1 cation transporter [Pelotalea chapellei]
MKNKIINAILILLVGTLLTVLALYVRTGATIDSVAVLKTGGMTCSSCSSKISKALETEKGVAAVEVDVPGGWVIIGYDSHAAKPELLSGRVKETGFTNVVQTVLTPEQFKQITGRNIGQNVPRSGCCGSGGCNTKNRS